MQETLIATGVLTFLVIISLIFKDKSEILKYFLFGGMVIVILGYTGYLIWSTIAINTASVTGGPVHYHADFEIYNCGQKVDLIDPKGWDNKVGTPLLHEHNDNRIHVEGPVLDYKDISLGNFFKVVGGNLKRGSLMIPTNSGVVNMEDGDLCNGMEGNLQVFVYRTQGKSVSQEKLSDPANYVLSSQPKVPPGDCIIIELDRPKEKTDKICTFYDISIKKGELND